MFVTDATGNKKKGRKYGQIQPTNPNQEFREIMQLKRDVTETSTGRTPPVTP